MVESEAGACYLLGGPVADLYAAGLRGGGAVLYGDLHEAVVELGDYVLVVHAGGEGHAAAENAVEALVDVEAHVVHVLAAFPRDGEGVLVERDVDVLRGHARELQPDHEAPPPRGPGGGRGPGRGGA